MFKFFREKNYNDRVLEAHRNTGYSKKMLQKTWNICEKKGYIFDTVMYLSFLNNLDPLFLVKNVCFMPTVIDGLLSEFKKDDPIYMLRKESLREGAHEDTL